MSVDAHGAYGLTLSVAGTQSLLVRSDPSWPSVAIRQEIGIGEHPNELGSDTARFQLAKDVSLRIESDPLRATYVSPDPLPAALLVHPYLAPVGATFAHWRGRETLHAGAFVLDGRAWALLADKEGGKSTAIASLARTGLPIVTDDLLVIDGDRALAGPRCVDLRRESAQHFGVDDLVLRRPEVRYRLALAGVEPSYPLAGWVVLAWGERTGAAPIPPAERLASLTPHRSLLVEPTDAVALLNLASLPAWKLVRPRSWARSADAVDCVLQAIS